MDFFRSRAHRLLAYSAHAARFGGRSHYRWDSTHRIPLRFECVARHETHVDSRALHRGSLVLFSALFSAFQYLVGRDAQGLCEQMT